jgi:hypothetical protein
MYVVFECFMLQVQTTSVYVPKDGQGQAAAVGVGRRHRPLVAVVEEMGASLSGGPEETGVVPV